MIRSARVFISYSHESDQHSARVLELANRLRRETVDAWIDRYIEAPAEGWPRWILNQIEAAEFVICVCTSAYRASFEGRNEPGRGLGVNAEGYAILQDLYDHGNQSLKYLPVAFGFESDVPAALRAFQSYRLPDQYDELYRRLTGQPAVVPPRLGPITRRPPLSGSERSGPLPVRSSGFEAQGEISRYLTVDAFPFERLAPGDGLFLSRLINRPTRESADVVTTVWVAARGPLQYVLDSARIRNQVQGLAGPVAEVAMPPDAEYRFTHHDGSDYETALNPALSVGPETRPVASFTVATAPDAPLYAYGSLWVWIRYHASDGRQGSFVLAQPFPAGLELARLLRQDVHVAALLLTDEGLPQDVGDEHVHQVVTPQGLQRGFEENAAPALEFLPIKIPGWRAWRNPSDWSAARAACLGFVNRRSELHRALIGDGRVTDLVALLSSGEQWAADLLGSLAVETATQGLEDRLERDPLDRIAFHGLCVRHLVMADERLAAHVIRHRERFAAQGNLEQAGTALAMVRAGDWIAVLALMAARSYALPAYRIMGVLQPELAPGERRQLARALGGPLGSMKLFVRGTMHDWVSPPPRDARLHLVDDRYEARLRLRPEVHRFKIADARWRWDSNWGAAEPGRRIELGETAPLICDAVSHDIELDLSREPVRRYRFEVDASDSLHPMVTVVPIPQ
jgi:hypothetical protein